MSVQPLGRRLVVVPVVAEPGVEGEDHGEIWTFSFHARS